MWCFALKVSTELELLIEIGFFQYCGVLKTSKYRPKKCREIYAQIPPHVGFVPPLLYPPYGGVHIPPHGKISMANPGVCAKFQLSSLLRNLQAS